LVQRKIDIELFAFVRVIHALNLTLFERDDFRFRTRFIERLARFLSFPPVQSHPPQGWPLFSHQVFVP
jgi:hypothetical protein